MLNESSSDLKDIFQSVVPFVFSSTSFEYFSETHNILIRNVIDLLLSLLCSIWIVLIIISVHHAVMVRPHRADSPIVCFCSACFGLKRLVLLSQTQLGRQVKNILVVLHLR